jgi:hypothetical protein
MTFSKIAGLCKGGKEGLHRLYRHVCQQEDIPIRTQQRFGSIVALLGLWLAEPTGLTADSHRTSDSSCDPKTLAVVSERGQPLVLQLL